MDSSPGISRAMISIFGFGKRLSWTRTAADSPRTPALKTYGLAVERRWNGFLTQ